MPPNGPVSTKRRDLSATLKKFGFRSPYKGSKHDHMVRDIQRLKIPNEHHHDVSLELQKRIIEAEIDLRE
ncbi:MAG: hypothetical protein M3008_05735 [Chloroflexota bacterium]|nr:hypothetical protein [Chloroflexota bacterium]